MLGVGGASLTLAGLQLPTPAGTGPRRRDGLRHPGAAGAAECRRRRRDRHLAARSAVRRAQRPAQRRRRRRSARREPLRARRGRGVRSHRVESALRHHAARRGRPRVRVPRRRDGRRRPRRGVRAAVSVRTSRPAASRSCSATGRRAEASTGSTACAEWVASSPMPLDAWVIEREYSRPARVRRAVDPRRRHGAGRRRVRAARRGVARRLRRAGVSRPSASATCCCDGPSRALRRSHGTSGWRRPAARRALGGHFAEALAAHDALAALDDDGARGIRPPRRRPTSRRHATTCPAKTPRASSSCARAADSAARSRRIPRSRRSSARATAICRSEC